ncbi:MAG TPA: efflux RND transporter periplasmic adaptor subunit [Nitrospira sp.]|uniref:efflux RND transporter periplasmic adaptor subunit n=1 Tax=Nitrospira sp. ND1 TaxID=1658518 RepID=UPI001B6E49A0|nr:efflux RND transporter periplasmic adaptor subunit [Nitrospira sp. ND1]MBK7421094.1 efflux RND transporter periplasmic adaptor subunit [Nitrospira sp.]MBK7486356.1 efflux RND transporter periplasmic adaptor subunit [Nitrospira sp.]MBK8377698.1 efflux RND transporter periplasmic adaptor subunit [Nitrospira sp.]MBK9113402.1 efflux RND transporter periplasmic adaptor subunit [Nitrospira sp.]MBP6200830.1 efflux RND transporter periplasmic adaptor subunit [Nitrospira sp.]
MALTMLAGTLAWFALSGCDGPPPNATGANPPPSVDKSLVRLTTEEIKSAGIIVQPVTRSEFRTIRDFPGTVEPNEHALAEITTLVRGRVIDVYADLGREVKGGTLLALLYSSELGMAQSAYLKATAKLNVAERAFRRAELLLKEKVIGVAELQRREGEMLSLRAELREARDRLLILGLTDEDLRNLDRNHTIRSHVPVVAPFDGRIIARNLTKGEVVETTEKLFVVADLTDVWVTAVIPEKDIPYIRPDQTGTGQSVEVHVAAYPGQAFQGRITYVGDVLDPATRTMRLRLELPNPERKLKPAMYATVRVYSEPEANALLIPESAVQRDRDRQFVFVEREPAIFEARDVKLGSSNGREIKVLDGLLEGESIVTNGAFVLKSELLGEQM